MNKVHFKNKDGVKLVGILHKPRKNTNSCIILCHGLRADKDEGGRFIALARRLVKESFAVFRFDFSGRGESSGKQQDVSVIKDLECINAAHVFLKQQGYRNFGILASSFAGASVPFFLSKHLCNTQAVTFWYPMLDLSQWLKEWRPGGQRRKELLRKGYFMRKGFKMGNRIVAETTKLKPWKELEKVEIPMLIVHGDNDQQVPYKNSVRYSKKFGIKLVTVHGGDHGFHNKKDRVRAINATVVFFSKSMKQ